MGEMGIKKRWRKRIPDAGKGERVSVVASGESVR